MRKTEWWASKPMKGITPKPKLRLPEPKLGKQSQGLVKSAVTIALAGAALGIGLAAFDSVSS